MHKNAILLSGQQHTIYEVISHIIMIKGFRKKTARYKSGCTVCLGSA